MATHPRREPHAPARPARTRATASYPKIKPKKTPKKGKKKKKKTKQENKLKKQNKIKYKSLFAESVPPVSSLGVGTRQATVGSGGQRPRTPTLTPHLPKQFVLFVFCLFVFLLFLSPFHRKFFYFFCCRANPRGPAWLRCLVGLQLGWRSSRWALLVAGPSSGARGPRDPEPSSRGSGSGREPSADCGTHSWVAVSCLLLKDIPGRQVPRGAGAIGTGG